MPDFEPTNMSGLSNVSADGGRHSGMFVCGNHPSVFGCAPVVMSYATVPVDAGTSASLSYDPSLSTASGGAMAGWKHALSIGSTASTDLGTMWLDYLGLTTTLTAMSESCDDDFHIDDEIAESAKAVAEVLRKSRLPAPSILRHGPRSAVFSWHKSVYALYLTIGAQKASVLATDHQGVIARGSCTLTNPVAAHQLLERTRVQEADVH